ncbi:MAG: ankyrin repeat domain-containing protein, partial [Prevotellaceae bacterium]|nr:ankyrin repeat domain-containing protein [Prevotellaceae bacterium]
LEEQGKYEQAEQIRAKYLGYEYISPEQLEIIKALALDPNKKETEVKRERKQLFQYAVNHRDYDTVDKLAKLQFMRAILYMKEVRADRKEYEKNLRLGNKTKVMATVEKYGVNFTADNGASGLMLAANYNQKELLGELLQKGASLTQTDDNKRFALDYLLTSFINGKRQKQKLPQYVDEKTLLSYWHKLILQTIDFEYKNRIFRIGSHSMLFYLILLMRNTAASQNLKARIEIQEDDSQSEEFKMDNIGAFRMDDLELLVALMPEAIMPSNRKKRAYINSIMAMNEIRKDSPYCKSAFIRAKRGVYILNPKLKFKQ